MNFCYRSYIDDFTHLDVNIYKDVEGKFNVVFNCKDMTEEQANRVFEYIVRPFFYDLKECGIKPSYVNRDLYSHESN